ncbi:MAG: GGDEF domain-containing protein [Methylococcales bacterium]|nr:GGDEF domain-containing protein [Methylococcales bacterium]
MPTLIKANNVRQHDYRTFLVINTIAYLGIAVHFLLIPLFYLLNLERLAFINLFSFLAWVLAWRINNSGNHQWAIGLMICEVFVHTVLVVPIMGWNAGFQYYLIGSIPFSLFNVKFNGRLIILTSFCLCLTFITLNVLTVDVVPPSISGTFLKMINYVNTMVAFAAIGIITYYFRLASLALEHDLELLAHTDSLTGLLNRRRMQEVLERQKALFLRNDSAFTFIIVDIDHFKKINDTYGHFCGDLVLSEAAASMKANLRKGDVLARWGGEEFLILLPDTDIKGAHRVAEHIRATIADKHFVLEGKAVSVTMTFGLAQYEGNSIDESLKLADNALYEGKEAGRNCVRGAASINP